MTATMPAIEPPSGAATEAAAIFVQRLCHKYGERTALQDVDLRVEIGEVFAILGPNGGGKTTLFRVLSTLLLPQAGRVSVLGQDCLAAVNEVRRRIGVVFQAPSLDKQLTVGENLRYQAALYGMPSAEFREREQELLEQLGLVARRDDRVRELSGGLRRRVELAKGMLHRPQLLLMDEPSTGLDPGGRVDLWEYLFRLRDQFGVTVVLTTHLLDEAERADRIAILHRGRIVAVEAPGKLRAEIGGDCITITACDAAELGRDIESRFGLSVQQLEGRVRLSLADAAEWVSRLSQAYPDRIESITLARPTLEDVFIRKTGHRFWTQQEQHEAGSPSDGPRI